MDAPATRLSNVLNESVVRALRALARVLLRHGLALPAFVELAKRAYVEVALNEFAIPGRKPSLSRAALLTGLTRKDVQRLADEAGAGRETASPILPENRAARVASGWLRDADFHDEAMQPGALHFDRGDNSFSALVRRYSGDVPPRAVLDELLRVGAVVRDDDGKLRLQGRGYIPRTSDAAKLEMLGTDVHYLISAIDHNLQGLEPSRYQRKVMYDNLPVEAMDEFRALSARRSQELIEELDAWLARHDRDANPAVEGHGRMRAGLGIFAIEEPIRPSTADRAPTRQGRWPNLSA